MTLNLKIKPVVCVATLMELSSIMSSEEVRNYGFMSAMINVYITFAAFDFRKRGLSIH